MWYFNVILKARQMGISTFVCLLFLDRCLFNHGQAAGIIAHTREDCEGIFKRIKFAYDSLPMAIRQSIPATNDSARELVFSNGSSLRVGTSMRGSTLQYLHISEMGKICAKYPEKAKEIITGSLNTVAHGQFIFIESTAEGREGYFYELCDRSSKLETHSQLDFKFHFFPWYKDPSYRIGSPVSISEEMHEYFLHLNAKGIILDKEQQYWYAAIKPVQAENMLREYPSTFEEAWENSTEGAYFGKELTYAANEGRICYVPYDRELPVHTAWDLGYNDNTAIWFFQVIAREIHLIDYVDGSGESLAHWLGVVKSKPYVYDKHLAPHDIMAHEYTSGMTRQASARKMGFTLLAVARTELILGIDAARSILYKCWFDREKCKEGLKNLENYKKEWDEKRGCWKSKPLHNWASNGSDAFRTLATGLHFITGKKTPQELAREQLESMRDESGMLPGSYLYTPHDAQGKGGYRPPGSIR
jgi:hypothetical protein